MHDQLRKKLIADKLYTRHRAKQDTDKFSFRQLHGEQDVQSQKSINLKSKIQMRDVGDDIFFNIDNFHIMFLDAGSSTNITKLARVNSRRVLLYMGNSDGIVAYGKGKGESYQIAYDDAVDQCKRNIICINIDHFKTVPGYLESHYNDMALQIFPAGSSQAWGHPMYYNILALAGLNNFRFRIRSRHPNKYSLIYCFFDCLTKNVTPRHIAQLHGTKIYQMTFGRGINRDYNSTFNHV